MFAGSIFMSLSLLAQTGNRYETDDNTSTSKSDGMTLNRDGANYDIVCRGVYFKMIFVEAGPFDMGFTDDQKTPFTKSDVDEGKKPHRVNITQNFFIGETEVTQELWNAVMAIHPSKNPALQKGDRYPVCNITWNDAVRFINRLNDIARESNFAYRFALPTEAQWEYAARGGHKISHTVFAGSDNLDEVGWYNHNSVNRLKEVKLLKPNELGCYDMTGNVWEFCQDWKANYIIAPQDDPVGPEMGNKNLDKVRRGGSYNEEDKNAFRVSYRRRVPIEDRKYETGLRLTMAPPY